MRMPTQRYLYGGPGAAARRGPGSPVASSGNEKALFEIRPKYAILFSSCTGTLKRWLPAACRWPLPAAARGCRGTARLSLSHGAARQRRPAPDPPDPPPCPGRSARRPGPAIQRIARPRPGYSTAGPGSVVLVSDSVESAPGLRRSPWQTQASSSSCGSAAARASLNLNAAALFAPSP